MSESGWDIFQVRSYDPVSLDVEWPLDVNAIRYIYTQTKWRAWPTNNTPFCQNLKIRNFHNPGEGLDPNLRSTLRARVRNGSLSVLEWCLFCCETKFSCISGFDLFIYPNPSGLLRKTVIDFEERNEFTNTKLLVRRHVTYVATSSLVSFDSNNITNHAVTTSSKNLANSSCQNT